ncbi:MAG: phage tail tube protein [Pseudomonadota bacterium]
MTIIAADHVSLSIFRDEDIFPLAALRRHELTLSRGFSDATSAGGTGWREAAVLDRPLTADLRASGVFVSGDATAALREAVLEAEAATFALHLPGEGTWQGAFHITTLSLAGQSEDEMTFSLRLTSNSPVTFTALP